MHQTIHRSLLFFLVCGSVATLSASPPVIGVARSRGVFLINNASAPGNATILDGTSVRTLGSSSEVSLRSGRRVTLGSGSAATIYHNRLVLESGAADLDRLALYGVEAGNLRIGASDSDARVHVAIDSSRQVRVAAIGGTTEIRNQQGVLVARVFPGTALQAHAVAGNSALLTGTVEAQGGKFFLTDEVTKVRVELRGANLKPLVGKRVRISGTAASGAVPAAGASQVIAVTQATVISAAAGVAGGAATGAAVSSGVSLTTAAVITGAAAAATVGGLAAAGTLSGSDTPVSR